MRLCRCVRACVHLDVGECVCGGGNVRRRVGCGRRVWASSNSTNSKKHNFSDYLVA